MKFNATMWQLHLSKHEQAGRSLIGSPTAQLCELLRKEEDVLQVVCSFWNLTAQDGKELMKQIWAAELAPKVRTFLWMIAHKALPTWERRYDWLVEMGIALCVNGCPGAPNTSVHILVTCPRMEAIWCSVAEWVTVRTGRNTTLPARFVLLRVAERGQEVWLTKESWWKLLRGWLLHQMWNAWTAHTFGINPSGARKYLRLGTKPCKLSKLGGCVCRSTRLRARQSCRICSLQLAWPRKKGARSLGTVKCRKD